MALLHKATLNPSKRELMEGFLASRRWAVGFGTSKPKAAYRFDDPAGEVGLEATLLGDADGNLLHVPLTYRGAPLEGAEAYLIGTSEHSALGKRWVYDGCGDPIWNSELAKAIGTGGTEVEQYFEVDGKREIIDPRMTVLGSGSAQTAPAIAGDPVCTDDDTATVVRLGDIELVVVRRVGAEVDADDVLTGRWADREAVLAGLRVV
jgi:Maltokinase N-terminal cap domain